MMSQDRLKNENAPRLKTVRTLPNSPKSRYSNHAPLATAEAVKSSELVAKSSQAGYQLGVRNVVDVLLAQRNAFAARRDYVNARYDYVVNVVKLHAAAGQLSASTLAELNALLMQ